MDKKMSFGVEKFSVIDDYSDSQLAIVEVYVCHDGNNLHDMPIDLSVIRKAKRTLKNKFLVAGFDGSDFEGHEPDEKIVGFFPESSEMKFVKENDKTYLVAQAIMSKVYAKWAYDIFVEDEDNYKSVSMEITVLGTEVGDDGLEHITKFVFNGVTLLGDNHMPACEGANASIIKFSKENALKVYSKRLKNSTKIKNDFVREMGLAESSRKEESEEMDKEKEEVTTVDEKLEAQKDDSEKKDKSEKEDKSKKEDKSEKEDEFEKEVDSDEDTYMEDDKPNKDKEDEDDKEIDDEDDKEDEDKESEDDDNEEDMACHKGFESLTVEQKYEVFRSAVRESLNGCGYLESFDDEYVYIYDYCDGYTYKYSYTLDGTSCTIDTDSKSRVMRGGYIDFEVYEDNNKAFEALKNENCELKEKLAAYETAEKEKTVEAILSEVIDVLPAERVAELRDKSANYSLDSLSVFRNEVRAIAFEAVATKIKGNKYSFERMTINEGMEKKTSKYGW